MYSVESEILLASYRLVWFLLSILQVLLKYNFVLMIHNGHGDNRRSGNLDQDIKKYGKTSHRKLWDITFFLTEYWFISMYSKCKYKLFQPWSGRLRMWINDHAIHNNWSKWSTRSGYTRQNSIARHAIKNGSTNCIYNWQKYQFFYHDMY